MATSDTRKLGRLKDGTLTFAFQVDPEDSVEKEHATVKFPVEVRDGASNLLKTVSVKATKPLQWFVDNGIWSVAQKSGIETLIANLGQGIKSKFPRVRADQSEVLEDLS